MLVAGDGEDAEGLVAVRAGDDGQHAGQPGGLGGVDLEDLRVRVGAAIDAPASISGCSTSAVYLARPETFSGPSTIGT